MQKETTRLALRMLVGKKVKSTVLIAMAAVLCLAIFGGSLITASLTRGFSSLKNRLGADIMVVPENAAQSGLESILLQGNTGYFYMDASKYDEIRAVEGVGQSTEQFFLASAKSSCCSAKVQMIGYDPDSDFVITPWIQKSYGGEIEDLDVVVGNGLNAFVGDDLLFYGTTVHVAAKLAATGTSYDYSVFMNDNTIRTLIQSSLDKNLNDFGDIDPENVISCVLVDVAEGEDVSEVAQRITDSVDGVVAVQTGSMISGISTALRGVSDMTKILVVLICAVVVIIMILVFRMSTNERRKEFATLRMIGSSRKSLTKEVFTEAALISLIGAAAGVLLGIISVYAFGSLIEQMLGLPYLNPGIGMMLLMAVIAAGIAFIASTLASASSARRIGKIDTALILRGSNK